MNMLHSKTEIIMVCVQMTVVANKLKRELHINNYN